METEPHRLQSNPVTIDQAMQTAVQHHQAGRLGEAEQLYRLVLEHAPNHPDALHLLGMLARLAGQFDAAAELIRKAIAINPFNADYHGNLGLVLMDQQKLDDAIIAFEQAIRLQPNFAQAFCNLGSALEQLGKMDQAVEAFSSAIQIQPQFFQAYSNLGNLLSKQKKFEAAISALQAARKINPISDDVNYNLGHALRNAGRLEEAITFFIRAIELNPRHLTARCDLGNVLRDQGKREQAIAQYLQAIAIDPNHAQAHWNLSLTYLLMGNFARGWAEHEWRIKCDSLARPAEFDKPRWNGEPLNGRTILLHPEQGFGDVLQFVRYVPMVAARDGKVVLQCQPELFALLKNLPGVSQIIPRGEVLPDFDLHCPLLSLAFVFDTRLDSIPAKVPYLSVDESIVEAWKLKLGKPEGLQVGLAWAGSTTHKNDHNRSLPLSEFSPLLDMAIPSRSLRRTSETGLVGIQFFSLQKGAAAQQIPSSPLRQHLIDHTNDLKDFAETAGLIANLDLIITVDTAVAHLAGGMGKAVWLMLPFDPDWRWLLDREDSPWYPTMRIFRQSQPGDWRSVVAQVEISLRKSLQAARL